MRGPIISPLLALLLLLSASGAAEPPPLRVASYNILGGRNTDGQRDLGRVAAVLVRLRPDVVALQEVDRGTRRIRGVDVPAELARRTGLHVAFAAAMPFDGGEYGEAVLSRWPFLAVTNLALPHAAGHEPRAALLVTVQPPGWPQPLTVIGTHLDHLADPADRMAQVRCLLQHVQTLTNACILAGDLNARPGDQALELLQGTFSNAWNRAEPGFTWPSDQPRVRIDHILVHPAPAWTVLQAATGPEFAPDDRVWQELLRATSDHLPLTAMLELQGTR